MWCHLNITVPAAKPKSDCLGLWWRERDKLVMQISDCTTGPYSLTLRVGDQNLHIKCVKCLLYAFIFETLKNSDLSF